MKIKELLEMDPATFIQTLRGLDAKTLKALEKNWDVYGRAIFLFPLYPQEEKGSRGCMCTNSGGN